MYKILFALATLTLLASCTQTPPSPAANMDDKNMMTDSDMMKDDMMKTETMNDDKKMMDDSMMKNDTMMTGSMEKPMMGDKMMMSGSDMMKDDMMQKESAMMKPTGYMEYDSAKVSEALKNGQKVALFFHASWCPSCRALDSAINADLSSIPADTLIVKVDYDNSEEMKKKYGVTSQHTTVLIDKDMALISKRLGAKSVSEVLN